MAKKRNLKISPNHSPTITTEASLGTSRLSRLPEFSLWNPYPYDADSKNYWEKEDNRAYSRDLDETSPVARSGIDQHVAYRVGKGLKYQSRIHSEWLGLSENQATTWQNNTEKRFHMWASSPMASVEGDLNFYEIQQLISRSETVSGDCFVILTRKQRNNWPFRTALQVLESDRVCNDNNGPNTKEIFDGIKRAVDGEIVSIFVANHHPGNVVNQITNKTWSEIPVFASNGRRNILHRKKMRRPGQTRGMPALSVIIGILKQHTRYTEAEVAGAVNAALITIVAEMDTDSFTDLFDSEQQKYYLQNALSSLKNEIPMSSGKILNTLPGQRITSPTPGRPNPNFGSFSHEFYTLFGMGLGMPKEVLTGLFESSYTAARAALQQLWQMIFIDRASDVTHVCQPVLETWLFDCVLDNIIEAPGFIQDPFVRYAWSGSEWSGSAPASLNPLDEARAAEIRAAFLTTESEETINYDGGDWAARQVQRRREAELRRTDSLPPLGVKPVIQPPATT
jgi:lambda family phage portal protein